MTGVHLESSGPPKAAAANQSSGPPKAAAANIWSWLGWLALAPLGAVSCGDDGGSSTPEGGRDAGGEAGSWNEPRGGSAGAEEEGGSGGASGSGEAGALEPAGAAGADAQGGSAGQTAAGGAATGGGEGGESGRAGSPTEPTGGTAGAGGSGEEPDETSPTIVTSTPDNGDDGVQSDVDIVVTFSEPMDRLGTQAAYVSSDLPADGVTFFWNDESTELTIDPDDELEYAEGDFEVDARAYELAFEDGATDLAGNPLVPESIRFRTLRRVTATLAGIPELDGYSTTGSATFDSEAILAGDLDDDSGIRGFVCIDLSSLPAELAPEDVESARLRIFQYGTGAPPGEYTVYCPGPACMGEVLLEHVEYGAELSSGDYGVSALDELGTISDSGAFEWKEADVLSAVREDIALRLERGSRSQYRLRFTTDSNGNGAFQLAYFRSTDSEEPEHPELSLSALLP